MPANGMLALNYPTPAYKQVSLDCPFTFDFTLSLIEVQSNSFSMSYPSMKAKVYLSYFNLNEHHIEGFTTILMPASWSIPNKKPVFKKVVMKILVSKNMGGFEITSNSPSNLHYMVTIKKITS